MHDHDHHHHHTPSPDLTRAFVIGIILNIIFVAIEFGAGLLTDSLALISDAGHNLSDVSSLFLALWAIRLLKVKPTQTFTYDALNRLKTANGTRYGSKTYSYDEIGNITAKDGLTYTYSKVSAGPHAVTSLSDGTTIIYDANGNMYRKSKLGTVMEYVYDAQNRLLQVKKNTTVIAEFVYDGDGGRVQKTSYNSPTYFVTTGVVKTAPLV